MLREATGKCTHRIPGMGVPQAGLSSQNRDSLGKLEVREVQKRQKKSCTRGTPPPPPGEGSGPVPRGLHLERAVFWQ